MLHQRCIAGQVVFEHPYIFLTIPLVSPLVPLLAARTVGPKEFLLLLKNKAAKAASSKLSETVSRYKVAASRVYTFP